MAKENGWIARWLFLALLYVGGVFVGERSSFAQSSWEKVVDDGDAGYSETGNAWASWSSADAYGGSYRYLSHMGQGIARVGTATWQVQIPYDGRYEVSVHFRQTVNRTTDADYQVFDGQGKKSAYSLNQSTLPTGWHKLGEFSWSKGQLAKVVLDGTDDNQSDEADAVRWRLIGQAPPPPVQSCAPKAAGTYTLTQYAGQVVGKGDWASVQSAQGAPDQALASSPNVDAGETLTADGFSFCTPTEPHTIQQVRVGVLAKTQYDSGPYKLILALSAVGKRFSFSQTRMAWVWGDITSAKATWTMRDISALVVTLGLDSQPGGKRDSDAWVDAFAVEVRYTSLTNCAAGTQLCGSSCVDLLRDTRHCGGCDRACAASEACDQGSCVSACATGSIRCGALCAFLEKDHANCGACGKVCLAGEVCEQGACVFKGCAANETMCGGACADTMTHLSHCGGCNKPCGEDQRCEKGQCTEVCDGGKQICRGGCVDTMTHLAHCGGCDKPCGEGEDCVMGRCEALSVCPPGAVRCGGACVDTAFDDHHCGGCDQRCAAGLSCLGARCMDPSVDGGDGAAREVEPLEKSREASLEKEAAPETEGSVTLRGTGCLCSGGGFEDLGGWWIGLLLFLLYRKRRRVHLSRNLGESVYF